MCVWKTKTIIGKAPRLGIHTPYHELGVSSTSILWEEMKKRIKQFNLVHIRVATPMSRVYANWAKMIDLQFGGSEGLELSGNSCMIVSAVIHSGILRLSRHPIQTRHAIHQDMQYIKMSNTSRHPIQTCCKCTLTKTTPTPPSPRIWGSSALLVLSCCLVTSSL